MNLRESSRRKLELPAEVYMVLALVWVTLAGLSLWLIRARSNLESKLKD
jgi:hypothetical protein